MSEDARRLLRLLLDEPTAVHAGLLADALEDDGDGRAEYLRHARCERAGRLFLPFTYLHGLDATATDPGPVIIAVKSGGGQDLCAWWVSAGSGPFFTNTLYCGEHGFWVVLEHGDAADVSLQYSHDFGPGGLHTQQVRSLTNYRLMSPAFAWRSLAESLFPLEAVS